MCWINWFSWSDKKLVKKMNDKIKHRWPDGNDFFCDDKVSLWHVRLSIIDLDERSSQPMFSVCWNYMLVFNWEIYNYKEIKKELVLLWYEFKTESDSEVILNSYIEWWNECHNRFNWMWAFVIYDIKNGKLIFSRDRFWIKPLYYYNGTNWIIFSSEIKGILKYNWYKKKVNDKLILDYLLRNKDTDLEETFFEWIIKFPNSCFWVYNLEMKEFEISKYWDLTISEDLWNTLSFAERKDKVKEAFMYSLKLHNISDVEVWSCLSWWIDSSGVVCWVDKVSNWKIKIKTFSAVFRWEEMDESEFIDIVLKKTNSKSFEVTTNWKELMDDMYDLIISQEEPFVWTSVYNQYRVMKLINEAWIKVTLDWQWWDEVFWWYYSFYPYYIISYISRWKFIKLCKLLIWMRKYYSPSFYKSIINPLLSLIYIILPSRVKSYRAKNKFWLLKNKYKTLTSSFNDKVWFSLKKWYYYEQMQIIQNLLRYADKNSMRWSIESRVPFLEKELVELAWKLPFEDKINNWLPKYIFREAMCWILPDEIKNRYDKKWFESPEEKLLRSKVMKKKILNIFSKDKLFISKYIDVVRFNRFLKDFYDKKNNDYRKLWKLLNLEIWWSYYFK